MKIELMNLEKAILLILFFSHLIIVQAQISVIVNSDGTHFVEIHNGNLVTVVNANGTHSVGMMVGNMINVVNADGSVGTGFYNETAFPKLGKVSDDKADNSIYYNHPLR